MQRLTGFSALPPADGGETIVFKLVTADGEITYGCSNADLSMVMVALRSAAHSAEVERQKSPFGAMSDEVIPALKVQKIRTGRFADGDVVAAFSTTDGFPVMLSMTKDQAQELIRKLHDAELQKPRAGSH